MSDFYFLNSLDKDLLQMTEGVTEIIENISGDDIDSALKEAGMSIPFESSYGFHVEPPRSMASLKRFRHLNRNRFEKVRFRF